jgi:hypothetical protein
MLSASMASTEAASIVLICSARATPRLGRPVRSGHYAGSQIRDRISDLPQWKKTWNGVTLRMARTGLPFTEKRSHSTSSGASAHVALPPNPHTFHAEW